MPIRDLKFVYVTFVGDYNISREFLIVLPPPPRNTTLPLARTALSPRLPGGRRLQSSVSTVGCGRRRWTRS